MEVLNMYSIKYNTKHGRSLKLRVFVYKMTMDKKGEWVHTSFRGRGLLITYWQTSSSLVKLNSFLILDALLGPRLNTKKM